MVGNEPTENVSTEVKSRAFLVGGNNLAVSEGGSNRINLKSTLNLTEVHWQLRVDCW